MARHRWAHKRKNTPAELARRRRYDSAEHQAARKAFAKLVATGMARCWRPACGRVLVAGQWQVGHNDAGTQIMGPECTPCNRHYAAVKGARVRAQLAKPAFVRPVR